MVCAIRTVYFGDDDISVFFVLFAQLFPRRYHGFTMAAPGREKLDMT